MSNNNVTIDTTQALQIVRASLELANRKGAFNLQDSANAFAGLISLEQYFIQLNNTEVDAENLTANGKRMGRPPGSKNKKKVTSNTTNTGRKRGRPRGSKNKRTLTTA